MLYRIVDSNVRKNKGMNLYTLEEVAEHFSMPKEEIYKFIQLKMPIRNCYIVRVNTKIKK